MKEGHVVVFSTASCEDEAARIAKPVIEEGLAACVNIVRGVRSIYSWKGKLHDDEEALSIYKTRAGLFERLKARIKELHGYEMPEIIALNVEQGSAEYLEWIDEATSAKPR